jgi:hypothetical protein
MIVHKFERLCSDKPLPSRMSPLVDAKLFRTTITSSARRPVCLWQVEVAIRALRRNPVPVKDR